MPLYLEKEAFEMFFISSFSVFEELVGQATKHIH